MHHRWYCIHARDRGKLAEWEDEGYIGLGAGSRDC
jgi:hypothetical protein